MPGKILVDTSFLFSLADPGDKNREKCLTFARTNRDERVIPDVVLTELTYLIRSFINYRAMMNFMQAFAASDAQLEPVTMADIRVAHEIMAKYIDARFDFVDGILMAQSERLNITRICTFDRRDFSLFRPKHCDFLELLP